MRRNKKILIYSILTVFLLAAAIVYAASDPLTISTTSLPLGNYGVEYEAQLSASGGSGDYEFSLAKGKMPTGLTLHSDGKITGTPAASGGFGSLVFQVKDSEGNTAKKQILLSIYAEYINFAVTENEHIYDGQPHQAVVTSLSDKIGEGDFTVLYGGSTSQTNPGMYQLEVQINKGGFRGRLDRTFLVIQKNPEATVTLESDSVRYDRTPHALVPMVSPAELAESCQIVYRAANGTEQTTPPSAAGIYQVTATVTSPYYETRTATATLEIYKPMVNFTAENTSHEFTGNGVTADLMPVVDSEIPFTEDFIVTYDNTETEEIEREENVTQAGIYNINVELRESDSLYQLGTVTPSTLTITPKVVDFTMDGEVWRDRDDIHYEKQVQSISCSPSAIELKKTDYTIYLAKEGQEPTGESISEMGTYNISIEIHNPNYTVGEINPGTFQLKGYRRVHFHFTDTHQEVDPTQLKDGEQPQTYAANLSAYYKGYVDGTLTDLPFTDDTAYTVYYIPVDESGNPDESKALAGGVTEEGRYLIDVRINDGQTERYRIGDLDGDSGSDETNNLPIFTLKFVDYLEFIVSDGSETQEYTGAAEGLTVNVKPVSELPEGFSYQVWYEKLNQGRPTGELSHTCVNAGDYQIHLALFDRDGKVLDQTGPLPEEIAQADLSTYRIGAIVPNLFTITPKPMDFTVTGTAVWIDKDREPASAEGDFALRSAQVSAVEEAVKDDFTVLYTLLDEAGNPTEANVYENGVRYEGTYAISIQLNNTNYKVGNLLVDGQAVAAPTFTAKTFRYIDFAVDQESLTTRTAIEVPTVYRAKLTPRYFDQSDASVNLTEGVDYQVLYTPAGKTRSADDAVIGGVTAPGTYAVSIAFTEENYRFRQFVDGAFDGEAVVLDQPVLFTLTVDCMVDFTVAPETRVLYEKGTSVYCVDVTPNLDEAYGLTQEDYIVTYTPVKEVRTTEAAIGSVTVPGSYVVSVDLTDETKAMGFKMGKLLNSAGDVVDTPTFTLLNPVVDFAPVKELICPLESYVIGETLSLSGLEMGLDYAYSQGTQEVLTLADLENYIYITAAPEDEEQNPVLFSTVDGTVFTEENKEQYIGRTVYVEYTVKTPVAEADSIEDKDVTFRYTLGIINVSEEPVLTIEFGNSPAAKVLADAGLYAGASDEAIAEALAGFTGTNEGHHTYNELFYDPTAWADLQAMLNANPDEDPLAYFASGAFHKNPNKVVALKDAIKSLAQEYTAIYSDGTEVDSTGTFVTLRSVNESAGGAGEEIDLASEKEVDAWMPEENSVYQLTYRFEDRREDAALTGRTVETSRYVIILSQLGDVNGDGNVNVADANVLTKLLKETQTSGAATILSDDLKPADIPQESAVPTTRSVAGQSIVVSQSGGTSLSDYDSLYLYRVCDVNHDGVVDALDAEAIKKRMVVQLRSYY